MFLAYCVYKYEDDVICDMAETYHIFSYKKHKPSFIATLLNGLKDDARIVMRLTGVTADTKTRLLAMIADFIRALNGSFDGEEGTSIYDTFIRTQERKKTTGFNTVEEYENRRNEIITKSKERR